MPQQRRLARVGPWTTPVQAVGAARRAEGFEKAPSAKKDRRTKRGTPGDYDARDGDLSDRMERLIFRRDERPDAPLDAFSDDDGDAEEREDYQAESERLAQELRAGRARIPRGANIPSRRPGQFMPKGWQLNVTSQGQVRIINELGRPVKGGSIRPAYRDPKGRVTPNIREPTVAQPSELRDTIEERLERIAKSWLHGVTPARMDALRAAYARDRKRRGWNPVYE